MSPLPNLTAIATIPAGHPDRAAVHQMMGTTRPLALATRADVLALIEAVNAEDVRDMEERLARRDREARIGQTVCAVILIVALAYIMLWAFPTWLLP